jgi:hypothetical protein
LEKEKVGVMYARSKLSGRESDNYEIKRQDRRDGGVCRACRAVSSKYNRPMTGYLSMPAPILLLQYAIGWFSHRSIGLFNFTRSGDAARAKLAVVCSLASDLLPEIQSLCDVIF